MTATTEAIRRGIERGARIAVTGDTTRLRELSEEALSTDPLTQAWTEVGMDLREQMSRSTDRPRNASR
jgi:hypothetical protein